MTNKQREAIETMQHWIEYEKKHKDEINKADELIHIQDTVLSLIKEQDKKIDRISQNPFNELRVDGIKFCGRDIKQYFERKAENEK